MAFEGHISCRNIYSDNMINKRCFFLFFKSANASAELQGVLICVIAVIIVVVTVAILISMACEQ